MPVVTINTAPCRALALVLVCGIWFRLKLFQWSSRCRNPMVEMLLFNFISLFLICKIEQRSLHLIAAAAPGILKIYESDFWDSRLRNCSTCMQNSLLFVNFKFSIANLKCPKVARLGSEHAKTIASVDNVHEEVLSSSMVQVLFVSCSS